MAVVHDGLVDLYSSDNPGNHIREAKNMDSIVRDYISSEEGKKFLDYAAARGEEFVKIKGVGAGDLGEQTVAAILHNGLEGVILGNYEGKSFTSRVSEMANMYGIDQKSMTEYVIAHELAHAAGYDTEAGAEGFIKDFFTSQAFQSEGGQRARYVKLAGIAAKREAEAKKAGK